MVVLVLERVSPSLRGELSRWMIEPRAGVFVGRISAMVRDRLWSRAVKSATGGGGAMIYTTNNEQGFEVRLFGDMSRDIVNIEGVWLVRKRIKSSS